MRSDTNSPISESADREMAAALDEALEAIQRGQPYNREALLRRYPQLEAALGAMNQLLHNVPTVHDTTESPNLPVACPNRIGRYEIQRELGAGSFGVVYLAYDPDVRRRVAIKVLHPGRIDQPEILTRFQREARATGRLRHPGIVQLFDFSPQGPPYYLVTEYVAGIDPRLWCRERQATPSEIARLVAEMADAIEYAHQHGVCHRDLKPANILIDTEGKPHILDFGLARLVTVEEAVSQAPTTEGHILGSLPYMAPEQALGHSHLADARSDVYSLGVILYELLTGRLPFQGPAHALPARVIEDIPNSPCQYRPELSADLAAICLKALNKRPQERYDSAAELAEDLRAFMGGQPILARPLSWWGHVRHSLDRRHLETLRQGWTLLLLLLGVTILAGCVVCNYWEMRVDPSRAWVYILLTKGVQVGVMLVLAYFLRPEDPTGQPPSGSSSLRCSREPRSALSGAERQIWSLVPGYYGSYLTLVVLNIFLDTPIPLAPILAMLSGMGFTTLGATIWGWFYVWGVAFFLLALVMIFSGPYGLTVLGLGWFFCLAIGSVHLHWTR